MFHLSLFVVLSLVPSGRCLRCSTMWSICSLTVLSPFLKKHFIFLWKNYLFGKKRPLRYLTNGWCKFIRSHDVQTCSTQVPPYFPFWVLSSIRFCNTTVVRCSVLLSFVLHSCFAFFFAPPLHFFLCSTLRSHLFSVPLLVLSFVPLFVLFLDLSLRLCVACVTVLFSTLLYFLSIIFCVVFFVGPWCLFIQFVPSRVSFWTGLPLDLPFLISLIGFPFTFQVARFRCTFRGASQPDQSQ